MMPGGTPKKTAQIDESLRRPRKRPGHSKLSGEATGTRPRFLKASHWPMLDSRFFGTSERSMSSMCAMHALSDVSLRSSTVANVPPPFQEPSAARTLATTVRGYNFGELRKAEVQLLRILIPRTL